MRYYVDTNVFIYAANPLDPRYDSCNKILTNIAGAKIEAVTSVETFQEIIHYSKRNKTLPKGLALCHELTTTSLNIVSWESKLLPTYLQIVEKYPSLESRDSLHLATSLENGLTTIISADAGFDKIKEIKRMDPKDFTPSTFF